MTDRDVARAPGLWAGNMTSPPDSTATGAGFHDAERDAKPDRRRPQPAFGSREEFIRFIATRRGQVHKEELIVQLCAGRDVLDLGCVDHSAQRFLDLGAKCLHARLKKVSRSLLGVDILEEDVAVLNAAGYDIIVGDVERLALGRQFDAIVAADLIEHLMNIGAFFDSVAAHLRPDGIFILSTPNPFNIEQTMRALFEQKIGVNLQHTCWLDPVVLYQLVSRSPFEIVDFHWVQTRFKMKCLMWPWRYLVNPLSEVIMRARPLCRRDFAVVLMLRG